MEFEHIFEAVPILRRLSIGMVEKVSPKTFLAGIMQGSPFDVISVIEKNNTVSW